MTRNRSSFLLGDLLVRAELLERQALSDALPIAMKTGLPVGRILISSGAIKETTLQAALFAQSLLRDRLLDEERAAQALRIVAQDGVSLDEALSRLGWKSEAYEQTNRLGQLFLDAGIITKDQLDEALEGFYTAGLPLARILVLQGAISNLLAFAALNAQKLVRDGSISRDQAIEALKTASENRTSIEASLDYSGYLRIQPSNTLRLGELLVLAHLISESDLLEAVERSVTSEQTIGESLLQSGALDDRLLEGALELQRMATEDELEPSQAAEALRVMARCGLAIGDAVDEVLSSPAARFELLTPEPLTLKSASADHFISDPALGFQRFLAASTAKATASQTPLSGSVESESIRFRVDDAAGAGSTGASSGDLLDAAVAAVVSPSHFASCQERQAPLQSLDCSVTRAPRFERLPAEEAARKLGTTVKTLTKRVRKGNLKGEMVNGKWFVELPLDDPSPEQAEAAGDSLPVSRAEIDGESGELRPESGGSEGLLGGLAAAALDRGSALPQGEATCDHVGVIPEDLPILAVAQAHRENLQGSSSSSDSAGDGLLGDVPAERVAARQLELIDKLLERVQELSYRNGYLEGRLSALDQAGQQSVDSAAPKSSRSNRTKRR